MCRPKGVTFGFDLRYKLEGVSCSKLNAERSSATSSTHTRVHSGFAPQFNAVEKREKERKARSEAREVRAIKEYEVT